ncbi:hypothetical protein [Salinibaculum salinum]|uniref:hypothetical protein n=1 Tax=Salinibaculum salinum TaxID=3131996 RepID=UPI0030ECB6C4
MRRRAVLRSLTAVTAAAATGLAGCSTNSTTSTNPCGTPSGDLQRALPRGNGYEDPSVDTNSNATEVGGATEHALGSYVTDDENFLFVISEFESEDDATAAASTEQNWADFGYNTTGYVVVNQYAYVAMGPSESSVTDLMAAAGPLNDDCAGEEIVFF